MSLTDLITAFKARFAQLNKTADQQAEGLANDIVDNLEAADVGAAAETHHHPGSGADSIAIGKAALATRDGGISIGTGAHTSMSGATAIGHAASSSGRGAIAIGTGVRATTNNQVRLGRASDHVSIPGKLHVEKDISLQNPDGSTDGTGTFRAADGTAGLTATIGWEDSNFEHAVTIKNGLIISWEVSGA